jgi:uncharacterized protein YbgA (DUF1722 family)
MKSICSVSAPASRLPTLVPDCDTNDACARAPGQVSCSIVNRRMRDELDGLIDQRMRVGDLIRFHSRHKLLLLAYSPARYAELGRVVARVRKDTIERTAAVYRAGFQDALATPPTRGRHVNVLQHAAGYFRGLLSEQDQRHLATAIGDYQRGSLPLAVPMALLTRYATRHQIEYLLDQVYLRPRGNARPPRHHA